MTDKKPTKERRKNYALKTESSRILALTKIKAEEQLDRAIPGTVIMDALVSLLEDEKIYKRVIGIIK